ncbi:MAG: competence/damage-inducible protein A [Proteobacteria bacterium]|nr:competence/damage-inducible protein A [Pseudomonadota bacterium]
MQASPSPTACMIIIGNEVLSGRTQDKNLSFIAKELGEIGVRMAEARVIPDIEQTIIDTVNECRARHTYVFTTGGIGPTHDDITAASVAKAFGVKISRHPEAAALLERHYGAENLNAARLKMAEIPEGATLVPNPVSAAPGFQIGNVFVLAGVPSIMQAMFGHIKPTLRGGAKIMSRTLSAYVTEGVIAEKLTAIQAQFDTVDIGSYPFIRGQRLGTSLVARGTDAQAVQAAAAQIKAMLLTFTPEVSDEDLAA